MSMKKPGQVPALPLEWDRFGICPGFGKVASVFAQDRHTCHAKVVTHF